MIDEVCDIVELLPADQWDKVMNQPDCDIEPVFMGFMPVYKRLAELIPHEWTVIDFGCAYNPQCFYFIKHKRYIAVDFADIIRFKAPNCDIVISSIADFIKNHGHEFNKKQTFAICSYVPDWGAKNGQLVRENFENVYVYYPSGGFMPCIKREEIKARP